MLKVFCCDSSIMKLNLYTTLVFFQLHLKCQCQWDFLACTVWIIQLTEFAKTVFPGNCTGQRWVKLSTVRDSGEPSQADRGQGHRWVKLSTVRDNAKSSWALSGTALSQAGMNSKTSSFVPIQYFQDYTSFFGLGKLGCPNFALKNFALKRVSLRFASVLRNHIKSFASFRFISLRFAL